MTETHDRASRADPVLESFSKAEIRRLYWVRATFVAERFRFPIGEPCTDHDDCRRLAFALWLRCSGRISDDHPQETIYQAKKENSTCFASN